MAARGPRRARRSAHGGEVGGDVARIGIGHSEVPPRHPGLDGLGMPDPADGVLRDVHQAASDVSAAGPPGPRRPVDDTAGPVPAAGTGPARRGAIGRTWIAAGAEAAGTASPRALARRLDRSGREAMTTPHQGGVPSWGASGAEGIRTPDPLP